MVQKEKDLLLKDLCSRLPYGVKLQIKDLSNPLLGDKGIRKLASVLPTRGAVEYDIQGSNFGVTVECVKPYFRPLSSMTEEEREEFRKVGGIMSYSPQHDTWAISAFAPEAYDWLNKKMFDYRGLIPMGLALEAPEDMYK